MSIHASDFVMISGDKSLYLGSQNFLHRVSKLFRSTFRSTLRSSALVRSGHNRLGRLGSPGNKTDTCIAQQARRNQCGSNESRRVSVEKENPHPIISTLNISNFDQASLVHRVNQICHLLYLLVWL